MSMYHKLRSRRSFWGAESVCSFIYIVKLKYITFSPVTNLMHHPLLFFSTYPVGILFEEQTASEFLKNSERIFKLSLPLRIQEEFVSCSVTTLWTWLNFLSRYANFCKLFMQFVYMYIQFCEGKYRWKWKCSIKNDFTPLHCACSESDVAIDKILCCLDQPSIIGENWLDTKTNQVKTGQKF